MSCAPPPRLPLRQRHAIQAFRCGGQEILDELAAMPAVDLYERLIFQPD